SCRLSRHLCGLPSFPTRRSSDLTADAGADGVVAGIPRLVARRGRCASGATIAKQKSLNALACSVGDHRLGRRQKHLEQNILPDRVHVVAREGLYDPTTQRLLSLDSFALNDLLDLLLRRLRGCLALLTVAGKVHLAHGSPFKRHNHKPLWGLWL